MAAARRVSILLALLLCVAIAIAVMTPMANAGNVDLATEPGSPDQESYQAKGPFYGEPGFNEEEALKEAVKAIAESEQGKGKSKEQAMKDAEGMIASGQAPPVPEEEEEEVAEGETKA